MLKVKILAVGKIGLPISLSVLGSAVMLLAEAQRTESQDAVWHDASEFVRACSP
jgi:hypothetical protein